MGNKGLAPRSIDLTFTGSAGQAFGTFLVQGVRLNLIGEGNDYVGKGLSGGRLVLGLGLGWSATYFRTHWRLSQCCWPRL